MSNRGSERIRSVNLSTEMLVSYALFLGSAALVIALFAAPLFRVSNITVTGASGEKSQIETATNIIGENIFTIRAAAFLNAVGQVPNLQPCGVTLSLPNTVKVCARVRRPVLGWQTPTTLFLVDKYGRIISRTTATSLPILHDSTGASRVVGRYVNPWIVEDATYALKHMRRAAIRRFSLSVGRALQIFSAHRWRAIVGLPESGDRLRKQVATIKALISCGFRLGHPLGFADLTHAPTNGIVRFHGLKTAAGACH